MDTDADNSLENIINSFMSCVVVQNKRQHAVGNIKLTNLSILSNLNRLNNRV